MKTLDNRLKENAARHRRDMARLCEEIITKKKVRYVIETKGELILERGTNPKWYSVLWVEERSEGDTIVRSYETDTAESLYVYLCGFIDAIYL